MFEAQSTSCFDIINKLAKLKIITTDTKHNLMLTVATSCEIRLKIYTKEQSQRDYGRNSENSYTIFHEILKIVDQDSIITYLQATYWQQREVINVLKIKETHIYSYLSFLIITICYALRLDRLMILLSEKYNKLDSSNISKFAEVDNVLPDDRFNRQEILVENALQFTNFDEWLSELEYEINNIKNSQSKAQSNLQELFSKFSRCRKLTFRKRKIE